MAYFGDRFFTNMGGWGWSELFSVLVKRKKRFHKTIPWIENPRLMAKSVLVNPISGFTKTTEFLLK